MEIVFKPEYDFIGSDSEYVRDCIANLDSDDFDKVYNATQVWIERLTELVTKRHDIPADIRIEIEKLKAYVTEAAETFKITFEVQAGNA